MTKITKKGQKTVFFVANREFSANNSRFYYEKREMSQNEDYYHPLALVESWF
jgi:hypothetical protein